MYYLRRRRRSKKKNFFIFHKTHLKQKPLYRKPLFNKYIKSKFSYKIYIKSKPFFISLKIQNTSKSYIYRLRALIYIKIKHKIKSNSIVVNKRRLMKKKISFSRIY